MNPRGYAQTMTAYNAWMNSRLYELAAKLSDAERKRDVGAFFKSIHGTLNHLLLADRVWMGRFTQKPYRVTSLSQELYSDFDELHEQRQKTDQDIGSWAAGLSEAVFDGQLSYVSIATPAPRTTPFGLAVVHFFNHQTHHRGQITTLLMQRGLDPGATDLLVLPQLQEGR
jgi:uncharacterized damage-inducible protein DinB